MGLDLNFLNSYGVLVESGVCMYFLWNYTMLTRNGECCHCWPGLKSYLKIPEVNGVYEMKLRGK